MTIIAQAPGDFRRSKNRHKSFLVWFFVALAMSSATLILPIFGFLYIAGELTNIHDVVRHQLVKGGLYSSEIDHMEYQHRFGLYVARRPSIVALGSSRVGLIAPDQFEESFVNLTGMFRLLEDAEQVYDDLVAHHQPSVIIVGLDHNWFHPDYHLPDFWRRNNRTKWTVSVGDLRRVGGYFSDGKLKGSDIEKILRDRTPNLGILAKLFGAGTDGYGVRHWGTLSDPLAISKALDLVESGGFQYYRGDDIDEDAWRSYLAFLDRARADGIRIIGFTTPLPPSIVQALNERGDIGWLRTLRQRVQDLPYHYDYFDPSGLNISDADFIDETHANKQATEQVLSAVLAQTPL